MRAVLVVLLRLYQKVISPLLPPSCRFYPSCSEYAVLSISKHGSLRGSILAGKRLARCHPWNCGGVDLVP
ncbi:MAG: membrane protein insertion efficiency factor YidD [Candidatus Eremiobacteraeota bacterium]|nr:membrane protein insertion efficiency factor YidD [Candidatus Eremiobacteraeota bacterium]